MDLLALDKKGNLVIIENKLDDTGRDVTWQALKYASYCSTLSKDDIKQIYQSFLDTNEPNSNSEDKLSEFFDGSEFDDIEINIGSGQRIFLCRKLQKRSHLNGFVVAQFQYTDAMP